MTGVRFRTGIFFTGEIETEMFSALLTEFKKVLIQDRPTDLTIANLHLHKKTRGQGFEGAWVQVLRSLRRTVIAS
jgi:hypothetical protein